MGVLDPTLPDFDLEEWQTKPYPERLKMMCRSWAMQGFGAPPAVYSFYVLKIVFYIGVWILFVTATPGIGGIGDIASWWATPIAFQKAVLWTLMFEGLGLGCASGPLTARYFPPIGGFLYFARPGTTRLPPWPDTVPFTRGHRRSWLDAGLYVLNMALIVRALLAPELGVAEILPVVLVLPILGLRDKTVFLAHRYEHYWVTTVVFLFAGDLIAGSKAVMWAIWWGAASSKLNHHFGSVITVMVSNSPVLRFKALRRAMYKDFPNDLRPSRVALALAHGGTAVEYTFPLLLVFGDGGVLTVVGLAVMTLFHLYITSSFPLGVPIEWNVFFLYAGWALFGVHAEVSVFSIESPLLIAILLSSLVVIPIIGNLFPSKISFLPSMRYYAGNWGTSLWAFRRDGATDKLDAEITKLAEVVPDQLRRFYDEPTTQAVLGKALAFRSMHLHGRALNDLLPQAAGDVDDYEIHDGEWVAGVVLGWNFGDGHLHNESLLHAIQEQVGFEEGELRCVFLESQPAHRPWLHWRIHDAATGLLAEGRVDVHDMLESQPWPDWESVGKVDV